MAFHFPSLCVCPQAEQRKKDVSSASQAIDEHRQRYYEREGLPQWQREKYDAVHTVDSLAAHDIVRSRIGPAYDKAKADLVVVREGDISIDPETDSVSEVLAKKGPASGMTSALLRSIERRQLKQQSDSMLRLASGASGTVLSRSRSPMPCLAIVFGHDRVVLETSQLWIAKREWIEDDTTKGSKGSLGKATGGASKPETAFKPRHYHQRNKGT